MPKLKGYKKMPYLEQQVDLGFTHEGRPAGFYMGELVGYVPESHAGLISQALTIAAFNNLLPYAKAIHRGMGPKRVVEVCVAPNAIDQLLAEGAQQPPQNYTAPLPAAPKRRGIFRR
ncbi:hypothetical protein ACMXZU_04395 [Corynebacterium striatum]